MKTFIEIAFEVLGCAVLVIGMITIFAGAVLQESYKNYPPTAEEIAENPELVRYAKGEADRQKNLHAIKVMNLSQLER